MRSRTTLSSPVAIGIEPVAIGTAQIAIGTAQIAIGTAQIAIGTEPVASPDQAPPGREHAGDELRGE
jgi:hypothetical protein